jgi:alpha-L-rhamnosidase
VGGVNQIQEASYVFEDDFKRNVMPHFTWHGFRYFSVEGEAENLLCNVIHTDVKFSSDFHCENPVVNWYYDAYKRSQLGNYHGCMPSDCPHIERLGYTGDGQITCETALLTFDSANLYRKWMRDILDSQNVDTGHVPHTAPFMGGGGGPCGWGGVVVILPYNFYQVTGSLELAEQYFDAILRWFDYIDTKSEAYFVVDEEPRLWCLGDWCIPKEGKNDPDMLDRPFVNTCYLVRCYDMASEMALAMGKTALAAQLKEKGEIRRKALNDKYFDRESGDFLGNKYGSNAYAVDTGLGDERTLQNLFAKYEQMDGFDTGIFGTEILLRTLGKHGRADIAFHLLNSRKEKYSFGHMMESGATTIWEYYNGRRSHNHPMFGGSVKILFTDFLGIKRLAPGYKKVRIAPADIPQLGETYGYITTPYGKIEVHVHRENGNMRVDVKAPAEVEIIE